VFPSEFEGLGTALQTAMATALPSISTARGALAEVVDDRRTALVVEPSGQEFAQAMLLLMDNARSPRQVGRGGRQEIIARFSAERMAATTISVYEDVLSKRVRTRDAELAATQRPGSRTEAAKKGRSAERPSLPLRRFKSFVTYLR